MAWGVILLASGDAEAARNAASHSRYWSRMQAWLRQHPLAEYAPQLRRRGHLEDFEVHLSEIDRLLERSDVLASGLSAGHVVGLVGQSAGAEAYGPASHRDRIVSDHALQAGPGPLRIRWVPDAVWHLLGVDHCKRAPRTAVLLDLLESDEPRARREAARALAQ
jgi:hypothetical protein